MSPVCTGKTAGGKRLRPSFPLQRWSRARASGTVTRAACEFTSRAMCQRRADVPSFSEGFFFTASALSEGGISTFVTPTSLGRSDDVGWCDNETSLMEAGGEKNGNPPPLSWEFCQSLMRSHSACAILRKINPRSYSNPPYPRVTGSD